MHHIRPVGLSVVLLALAISGCAHDQARADRLEARVVELEGQLAASRQEVGELSASANEWREFMKGFQAGHAAAKAVSQDQFGRGGGGRMTRTGAISAVGEVAMDALEQGAAALGHYLGTWVGERESAAGSTSLAPTAPRPPGPNAGGGYSTAGQGGQAGMR